MATTRESIEKRAEELREKLRQLDVRKQAMDARDKAAQSKKKRSNDTRRKILLGAMLLDAMDREEILRADLIQRLDKYLSKPRDRALFDLENPQ